jgi:hypothetical protein
MNKSHISQGSAGSLDKPQNTTDLKNRNQSVSNINSNVIADQKPA